MRAVTLFDVTTNVVLSAATILLVVPMQACERQVSVHGQEVNPVHATAGSGATQDGMASGGTGGGNTSAGRGNAAAAGGGGRAAPSNGAGGAGESARDPGASGSAAVGGGTQVPAGGHLMDGIEPADTLIADVAVMYQPLGAIELPATGDQAVSLTQYPKPNTSATLHIEAGGQATWWYESLRAYYVYSAAHGAHFVDLVQTTGRYGIHVAGDANEISGTPTSYKEYLSANADGFAWIDYGMRGGAAGGPPMTGGSSFGAVVFKTWSGTRSEITDARRYRARIELSATHVAFVEYADTAPGAVGQIVVQPIAGGEAIAASPSANHQDRPTIDGDWVVWEEFVGGDDAVIRGRNLETGEVRDISAATGFRTNPDIRGTRVVWEDQRGGDADIYYADLAANDGEHMAVSGPGHSTAIRLTADGLVWIEVRGETMGLMRARWAR